MIEVVIDTNVLVAAFRSSLGSSYRLLQTLGNGSWLPVVSPAVALEYEAVLKRLTGHSGLQPPTSMISSNTSAARRSWSRSSIAGVRFCRMPMMIVSWKWRSALEPTS